MGEIRNLLGGEIYKPTEWIGRFRQTEGELRVQIYEDKGQGFSEENSYFPENVYVAEKEAEFTVKFDGNVHYLRLDPAMCSCICKIRELSMNGQPVPLQDKKVFTTNGKILKSEEGADHPSVIFATEDPNMTIRADVLRGHTDAVILAQLMRRDSYGYEINKVISTLSNNRFELKEATLYTAFKRLEELGYIASYWGDSGAGARRRYYTITSAGREACHRLLGEWQETKEIMDKLLEVEEKL